MYNMFSLNAVMLIFYLALATCSAGKRTSRELRFLKETEEHKKKAKVEDNIESCEDFDLYENMTLSMSKVLSKLEKMGMNSNTSEYFNDAIHLLDTIVTVEDQVISIITPLAARASLVQQIIRNCEIKLRANEAKAKLNSKTSENESQASSSSNTACTTEKCQDKKNPLKTQLQQKAQELKNLAKEFDRVTREYCDSLFQ